jgi:transposase
MAIAVRQGLRFLRQQLPDILAKRSDVLSPRMIRIMEDLSGDWRRLDERIEHITKEIEVLAGTNVNCGQLMTVPGIGPIVASATVAAIGNGAAFARGRDFAAWLGLVPKQMSTGDRARSLAASRSAEIAICVCSSSKALAPFCSGRRVG